MTPGNNTSDVTLVGSFGFLLKSSKSSHAVNSSTETNVVKLNFLIIIFSFVILSNFLEGQIYCESVVSRRENLLTFVTWYKDTISDGECFGVYGRYIGK